MSFPRPPPPNNPSVSGSKAFLTLPQGSPAKNKNKNPSQPLLQSRASSPIPSRFVPVRRHLPGAALMLPPLPTALLACRAAARCLPLPPPKPGAARYPPAPCPASPRSVLCSVPPPEPLASSPRPSTVLRRRSTVSAEARSEFNGGLELLASPGAKAASAERASQRASLHPSRSCARSPPRERLEARPRLTPGSSGD